MHITHITVNGRRHWFERVTSLRRLDRARWLASSTHGEFIIEGGRHAGGGRRDWFLESPEWTKPIYCTSLIDALRCIETM